MSKNHIHKCTADQVQLLHDLSIKTYRETFAETNSEALLQQYFKESLNVEKLTAQLQTKNSEFYFIYCNTKEAALSNLAGFLKLNIEEAQTDLFDSQALEVEKIYISKDYLSQGLGKELITFATERAQEQNKQYIWLGVWENNFPAQAFYKKMGFEVFGAHDFDMGGDIQTDLLLKKTL